VKAYLIVCTVIFALIAAMHSAELAYDGAWHLREPDFLLSSLVVLGMLGWSILLLARHRRN
jgi:hypothetical protein